MNNESHPADGERLTQLAEEVATLREALAAYARHHDAALAALREEVVAWQRWAEAHEQRTGELRTLRQTQQGTSDAAAPTTAPGLSAWQRWRDARRGLGASLTITGVVAGVGGVLLHLALKQQVIDTTLHLGYLIGLVGLLLFLLGLLIVF